MFKSDLFWHEHNFSFLMWSMLMSPIYEKNLPLYLVAFLTGLGVSTTCQLPVLALIPVLLGCDGAIQANPLLPCAHTPLIASLLRRGHMV